MRKLNIPSNLELQNIQKIHKGRSLPYYKESFAADVKVILDKLHENNKPVRITAEKASTTTLRLQYYQGVKYLIDHDESGHYAKLYKRTKCSTYQNYLEFHIRAHELSSIETIAPWKDEFTVFIETSVPNDKFYRDDVSLSDEEISWINDQLAPLVKKDKDGNESPLFYGQVEKNKILLIRDDNS